MKVDIPSIKLSLVSCFCIGLLLMSEVLLAQSNEYECIAEPKSERLVYQSIAGVPASFKPKPSRYVDSYTKVDVLVDVRSRFAGEANSSVRIKKALQIPLYSLKTKTYLKNKRVVLIGTGLDDYFLEQEITKLQKQGFRSLKIMRFGITALLGSNSVIGSSEVSLKLKTASAQDIVSASLGHGQDFLFINVGQSNPVYTTLGLESISVPFVNEKGFYEELYSLTEQRFKTNDLVRIVIVHDDPEVYRTIFQSKNMFDMQGLIFIEGGNTALVGLQKQLTQTYALSQKIKRSCSS